jgi:tRNA dimethylallyltransferase
LSIASDLRLADYDPSQVSLGATLPVSQSDFGMVTASRLCIHPVACSHSPMASAKQPGTDGPLVAIVGPTASGKSALALFLADVLNGEIVNYDSVQVYRCLDVGSGKVSTAERRGIPHHLLDLIGVDECMTAGEYRRLALRTLADVAGRGKVPVLVGGTGLYLRALLRGLFEGPTRSDQLRARLRAMEARRGRRFLHTLLNRLDPDAAQRIHAHDVQKVIRTIEVCVLSGQPISRLHEQEMQPLTGFHIIKVGLNPDRTELRERINRRVELMFTSGLIEEARALLEPRGASAPTTSGPRSALGYRQACQFVQGESSFTEAVRNTQNATRRYAKRQWTWFRREPDVTWFHGFGFNPDLQHRISEWLLRSLENTTGSQNLSHAGMSCLTAERTHR